MCFVDASMNSPEAEEASQVNCVVLNRRIPVSVVPLPVNLVSDAKCNETNVRVRRERAVQVTILRNSPSLNNASNNDDTNRSVK